MFKLSETSIFPQSSLEKRENPFKITAAKSKWILTGGSFSDIRISQMIVLNL